MQIIAKKVGKFVIKQKQKIKYGGSDSIVGIIGISSLSL